MSQPTMGTPQGGPLSPLLSNILLDDLDRELERRGHRFCRYADDVNVYVRSRRAEGAQFDGKVPCLPTAPSCESRKERSGSSVETDILRIQHDLAQASATQGGTLISNSFEDGAQERVSPGSRTQPWQVYRKPEANLAWMDQLFPFV